MCLYRSMRVVGVITWVCLLLSTMAPLQSLQTAHAGGTLWCKSDPLVLLEGELVNITVSIPFEYLLRVDGPTQVEIATPGGVERRLLLNDLGFMLQGSTVTFIDEGVVDNGIIPVVVRVMVPMRLEPGEVAPMQVDVQTGSPYAGDAEVVSVVGTNQMTTVRLSIPTR